jgi:hypothetical protein
VLAVPGFATTLGRQLDQWTANGGSNQQWYLQPTSDALVDLLRGTGARPPSTVPTVLVERASSRRTRR